MAHLEYGIFPKVPVADAPQFAVDFLASIPVGADLSLVAPQFLLWLLMDDVEGIIHCPVTGKVAAATQGIGDLLMRFLTGETITLQQWQTAKDIADSSVVIEDSREDDPPLCCGNMSDMFADVPDTPYVAYAASCAALAGGYTAYREPNDAYNAAAVAAHTVAALISGNPGASTKQAIKLLQLLREAPVTASPKRAYLTRLLRALLPFAP